MILQEQYQNTFASLNKAHARERIRTVERTKRPDFESDGFDRSPTRAKLVLTSSLQKFIMSKDLNSFFIRIQGSHLALSKGFFWIL